MFKYTYIYIYDKYIVIPRCLSLSVCYNKSNLNKHFKSNNIFFLKKKLKLKIKGPSNNKIYSIEKDK